MAIVNSYCIVSSKWIFILLLLIFGVQNKALTQNDSNTILKHKIDGLVDANEIMTANRLINSNTSLNPEYVIKVLNNNLDKARSNGNQEALAYTYLSIGNFWFFQGHKIKAYENFFQSEKFSRKYKFDWILALALMNRSHLELDNEHKLVLLREAITMFSKLNDPINLAKAHLNIGQAFIGLLKADSLKPDYIIASQTFGNRWSIRTSSSDSAFVHYNSASRLNDSISHPEIEASVNVHFAEWYKLEGDLTKAKHFFNTASYFFGIARQSKGQIYCLLEEADIEMQQKEFNKAVAMFEEGAARAFSMGYQDYLANAYKKLSLLYEKTGHYDKALEYQRHYTNLLMQLNEAVSQDKIHALNLEYTLSEQALLINSLNQKKRINRILMIMIITAAALVVITSYLLVKNKKRKLRLIEIQVEKNEKLNEMQKNLIETDLARQKLDKELLEVKVKVKTERIIMIANQMKKLDIFLQSLNRSVKSIADNSESHKLAQKVNDLKYSLSKSMFEQSNLHELQILSDENNQDFFSHIRDKYTGITNDDIKLLSFLIMNMESKEIASYFNITQESINKKRYRLRQKLKIPKGKSFVDFYSEVLDFDNKI